MDLTYILNHNSDSQWIQHIQNKSYLETLKHLYSYPKSRSAFLHSNSTTPNLQTKLPDVLCAAQISFEGKLDTSIEKELAERGRGSKPSGDMIPWILSQQYMNSGILNSLGVRVVRIATHPEAVGLGLGSRMLTLIKEFFSGQMAFDGQKLDFFKFLNGIGQEHFKNL